MRTLIADIKIGTRYRKDFGDIDELANSLSRVGQIQPIVLTDDNTLIAGERRLRAAKQLGWEYIETTQFADLDETTQREIEIEENVRRKEFNWPEEVLAIEQLYNLKQAKYGKRIQGLTSTDGYGLKEAEGDFDKSKSMIAYDLELARAIHTIPKLAEEKTKSAAMARWKREREKQLRIKLASQMHLEVPEEGGQDAITPTTQPQAPGAPKVRKVTFPGWGIVYHGPAEYVTRHLPAGLVDCVVTDPPYGLALFGKEGSATSGRRLADKEGALYDDDPHKVLNMLDMVVRECARVLKPDGHFYMFFHHNWYEDLYQLLVRTFGEDAVAQSPCMWIKNTPGIGDPNHRWVYAYEPFFFVNRGRPLIKPQGFNWIKYDTVPPKQKTHPTEKPPTLLRHIIEASCVKGETVLDPFAGSGSTLAAAVDLGCKFYGIELDEAYFQRIVDRMSLAVGGLSGDDATANDSEAERPA